MYDQDIHIAKYIVNRALQLKKPINNAKLNQIAMLLHGYYLKTKNKSLFKDKFSKWYYPCNESIYQEFKDLGSEKITDNYIKLSEFLDNFEKSNKNNTINVPELKSLDTLIGKLILTDDFELISNLKKHYDHNDKPFSGKDIMYITSKVLAELNI